MVSDFVSVSDETFLLLTIDNNYERWLEEAKYLVRNKGENNEIDGDDNWRENLVAAKYTNLGGAAQNGKGSNRRCGGWSKDGYLRFNHIYKLVVEDRKQRANFELSLKTEFEQEQEEEKEGGETDDDEEIIPANDMAGVIQPV